MCGKQIFRLKSKNKAAGKSDDDVRDQTRRKPSHLPEVVPRGAADDHVLRQVLQPAPPGLLVGLDYQPPVARKVGCVKPPRVDSVEVYAMSIASSLESGGMRAPQWRCLVDRRRRLLKAAAEAEMAVAADILLSSSSVIIVGEVFA